MCHPDIIRAEALITKKRNVKRGTGPPGRRRKEGLLAIFERKKGGNGKGNGGKLKRKAKEKREEMEGGGNLGQYFPKSMKIGAKSALCFKALLITLPRPGRRL